MREITKQEMGKLNVSRIRRKSAEQPDTEDRDAIVTNNFFISNFTFTLFGVFNAISFFYKMIKHMQIATSLQFHYLRKHMKFCRFARDLFSI